MALSGSFGTNVGSFWRIQVEWSATQNVSTNTSSVTARLYWMAQRSGVGAVYASSADTASITINGNSDTTSATPALNPGQKKLIFTRTVSVPHNSDGTKTFTLSAFFDVYASLSGTWTTRVSTSSSITLNTIPRASSLANTPNWTAGNNTTISINRSSSSFRHEVDISIRNSANTAWTAVKKVSLSSSQTSVSSSFSNAELTSIFSILNGRASAATRMVVTTFNGSTSIGTSSREGTITAPAASIISNGYYAYAYTDGSISLPITRNNSGFTHTVRFKFGSYTKTITGVGTSVSWTPSAAEQNLIHAQMPNVRHLNGTVEVDTLYGGKKVRSTTSRFFQIMVRNADPVFSGNITYLDTNTATVNITGNNQAIVQGKSIPRVTLSASAVTPQKGATMKSFIITLAGQSVTVPYTTSSVVRTFAALNASTNQTIIIEAVDSRGSKTAISKAVTVIPYAPPSLAATASRVNGFEASTNISVTSNFSPLSVNNSAKNYTSNRRYRTRIRNGTWGSWQTLTGTDSNFKFTSSRVISLPITQAYEVEFSISDRLHTTTTTRMVGVGRPILFIDDVLGSVGFNDFPKDPNSFLLNGRLTFAGNQYASGEEGAAGGAIDLANGDMVGLNGLYFNDIANNNGEGLLFLKSGRQTGSGNVNDYDNLRVLDGKILLNGNTIVAPEHVLWQGVSLVAADEIIVPSTKLSDCPNGWILVWSRYVNGASANSDWGTLVVPKVLGTVGGGVFHYSLAANAHVADPPTFRKYVYFNGTDVRGYSMNTTGTANGQCLRYVIAF